MRLIVISLRSAVFVLLGAPIAVGAEPPALRDVFKNQFRVGAAIGTEQAVGNEAESLKLVARQFNTITPENLFKWQEIHPQPDQFNFEPADRFVEFGQQHGMFVVGHTLIWHNQTPSWVFEGEAGTAISREALLERMRDHIHRVVGRYKGRVGGWDVVNEAIDDDGTMRKTKWHQIIGDDYLIKAFEFAHEADPRAELYYNDYNEWHPKKRVAIKKLVSELRKRKIRIDAIGLQGHWGLDYPQANEIEAMFEDYGRLGVKLMITELDMTLLPDAGSAQGADVRRNDTRRRELDPYSAGLPEPVSNQLAARYAEIFRLFVKHADKLDRITFWGVHDGQSWRNNWPMRGRTDYPLLFDRNLKPKSAFFAVVGTVGAN
jgi:endo-1,4-beta-xylanase